jgi:MoxR-like ATPase
MPVLDQGQRYLRLDEADGQQTIKVAQGVTFIATANIGNEYTATRQLDKALMDRFTVIEMDLLNKENLYNKENREITISREDLASLIGTATVTTIRMLTNFKEEKLLFIGAQSEIIIKDKKSLEEIALFG